MKPFLGILLVVVAMLSLMAAIDPMIAPAHEGALRLVVTQTPAQSQDESWSQAASLSARYPLGSRIVLVECASNGARVTRVLSKGLNAAGAPSLSPRGDRIVFAGRQEADSDWCIYESSLDRGRPSLRAAIAGDCADPAYLPKGEVVFVASDHQSGSSANGGVHHGVLYRTTPEQGLQRISFGPGAAQHPSVLDDGRVLFSMQTGLNLDADPSHAMAADAAGYALFTVNPDGTMLDPFAGVHDTAQLMLRARQTEDGRVVFLTGPAAADQSATAEATGLTPAAVEFARPMGPRSDSLPEMADGNGAPWVVTSVEAGAAAGWIVCARAASVNTGGAYAVWLTSAEEPAQKLFDDPAWNAVEALPVVRTAGPRARPSSVNMEAATGTLVCYDAGRSDQIHGPKAGAAAPASVAVETLARGSGTIEIGRATLSSDRSFFVSVPTDLPLRVRSYDREQQEIATSGWFWIRPGETRACFGCHERRDTAPPNQVIEAVARGLQEL